MFYKFFGLSKNPFEVDPDPNFLYLSPQHREALSHLTYSVIARKPYLLLTGDIGVGKTTLLNYFIRNIKKKQDIFLVPIYNPNLTIADFYHLLSDQVKIGINVPKPKFLIEFSNKLLKLATEGKALVIVIDEAQAASEELLEELRLLSNATYGSNSLIMILVGQPDLLQKLSSPKLSSLRQRFSYRYHLGPFQDEYEVSQYLITRILRSGSPKTRIFNNEAIAEIFHLSRGVPRVINILAEHAMINAYLRKETVVGREDVKMAAKEVEHVFVSPKKSFQTNFEISEVNSRKKSYSSWFLTLFLIFFLILTIYFLVNPEKISDFWRLFWGK